MSRVQTMSFTGLIVVVAGVCLALGVWQLDRLAQRRAINLETQRARSAPMVDLAAGDPGNLDQRRVMAKGQFDRERAFVLRSRPHRGFPGVELVVPLRLSDNETAVLVNLGWIPAADAVHFDPTIVDLPASDSVIGLARDIPLDPERGRPVVSRGDTTWRHIEFAAANERLPYPILSIVINRMASDSAGGYPRALPAPPLDDGPHLGYALQWFSFAIIAMVGGVLWVRKRRNDT